jgi:hypothetical protein
MFGMSSTEFWEEDPQLYWAYRTFYLKQKEMEIEEKKYDAWLKGSMDYMAVSISINNAFGKQKINYPTYEEMNSEKQEHKQLTKKDVERIAQEQFNAWARF